MCNGQIETFLKIYDEICFPVSPEKTVWGSDIIIFLGILKIFLGILINTISQTICIPMEKRVKSLNQLNEVLAAR